eukprot:jgi/Picre1/27988/NNA_000949.t1
MSSSTRSVETVDDRQRRSGLGSENVSEQTTGAGYSSSDVPLLVTTVDIRPGVSVQLPFYQGDDPLVVAQKFCAEHGLPESVVAPLKEHIENHVREEEEKQDNDTEEVECPEKALSDGNESSLMDRAHETVAEVAAALESLTTSRNIRPASATSSLGTEYFGRAELPVTMHRSAEAEAAMASDRLYADYFRKEMMLEEQRRIKELENQLKMQHVHCTEASRMMAAHRTADGYASYGERLYQEGMEGARQKEETRKYLKEKEIEKELEGATFHPQISKLAQGMKLREAHGVDEAWVRLYHKNAGIAARKKAREDAIRREKDEEEMKECSFRPQLSKKSEQIEATFKPEINKTSIKKAEKFNRNGPSDVADRLLIRGQVYNERLEQARHELESDIDPVTGRKLFHPKTFRGPKNARDNVTAANVGEHLYQEALESAKRVQEYVKSTHDSIDKEASKAYVNASSQKMMERLKLDRIKAVYAYLAQTPADCFPPESIDIIGVVSNEKFMDTIDPEVRADVELAARLAMRQESLRSEQSAGEPSPTLTDMSESSLVIEEHPSVFVTESTFINLMNEVIRRTRGYTRAYLLPMPGTRKKWEEPTFKPALDTKSRQMAERLRPKSMPSHEILYNTAADTAAKIELMKKEIEAEELKACTFKPSLESTADTRPQHGRALTVLRKPAKSLFHVAESSHSEGSQSSYSPGMPSTQSVTEAQTTKADKYEPTSTHHQSIYDGIDAIENEIKDAIAQLTQNMKPKHAPTPRKDAMDVSHALDGSLDCEALFASPKDLSSPYDLHVKF